MRYSELTKSQKLCIDEFIKFRPELATAKSISRQEVEEIWKALYERRNSGGVFFGYPMWLIRGPKVSRGLYEFPSPENDGESMVVHSENDDPAMIEFLADCKNYGIII